MKTILLVLVIGLLLLFFKSFVFEYTIFSNDSTLGQYQALQSQEAGASTWQCNNWIGEENPPVTGISAGLRLVLGETHHASWDKADILSAICSFLCFLFPFTIIAASIYREFKYGEPL